MTWPQEHCSPLGSSLCTGTVCLERREIPFRSIIHQILELDALLRELAEQLGPELRGPAALLKGSLPGPSLEVEIEDEGNRPRAGAACSAVAEPKGAQEWAASSGRVYEDVAAVRRTSSLGRGRLEDVVGVKELLQLVDSADARAEAEAHPEEQSCL